MKFKFKITFRRIIAVLAVCSLIFTMTACTKNKEAEKLTDKQTLKQTGPAKGRYVETNINLPEAAGNDGEILTTSRMEDNSLHLAVRSEKNIFEIYESKDEGKTWNSEKIDVSAIPKESAVLDAAMDKKGNIIIAYGKPLILDGKKSSVAEGKTMYLQIDAAGKSTPLNVKLPDLDKSTDNRFNSLSKLKIAPDGDLFGIDGNGTMYQIDLKTGAIRYTYISKDAAIFQYGIVDNRLILVTGKGVEQYSINDGKALDNLNVLKEYFKGVSSEAGKLNNCLLTGGNDENELYFCTDNGLFRYILGGNIVEQIVEGSLSSLALADMNYLQLSEQADGSLLILFKNYDSKYFLKKYSYSKEVSAVPGNEITVYSLKDNSVIRQEITLFQKVYPDIHVIYETGISEKDGASSSDAIKTLNTELLAGKGPDVLIMDDLPIGTYIDKGLLSDVSDVLGEYTKTDKLFKNIVEGYKSDGGIYAVPTRFGVPIIYGKKEVLNQITDLKSLADFSNSYRASNPGKGLIFDIYDSEALVRNLYSVNADQWIKKDGSVDKDKLTEFLNLTKDVYQASIKGKTKEELDKFNDNISEKGRGDVKKGYLTDDAFSSIWPYDAVEGKVQLNIGSVRLFIDYTYLASALQQDGNMDFKPLEQDRAYFIPFNTAAVNADSGNQEVSKKFLSYLLGAEAQKVTIGYGLPVNREVFLEAQKEKDVTDLNSSLGGQYKIVWPAKNQFEKLTQVIEGLKTPIFQNSVIINALVEVSDNCMTGKISVEQAADEFIKKVNIYLSE